MKILGVGAACNHDPSAALLIDGKLVAAAEEERFIRIKHAPGKPSYESAKFCLKKADLAPQNLDAVAFAWNPDIYLKARWQYAKSIFIKNPYQARKAISKAKKINKEKVDFVQNLLNKLGIDKDKVKVFFIEHHLAHAASSFYLSGMEEAAVMSIDGSGEYVTTLLAEGKGSSIRKIREFYEPNSLGLFYSAMTEFLGFKRDNGEYKVMGMSAYGDSSKVDLSRIVGLSHNKKSFFVNPDYIKSDPKKRYNEEVFYSKRLAKEFGFPRKGADLSEPYIHIAAAVQKALEDVVLGLVDTHFSDSLKKHGNLCFAGGCALNVRLNRKLIEHPLVKNLFVQPASHDAGSSLGAAVFAAKSSGEKIEKMQGVYLGPEFSNGQIEAVLKAEKAMYKRVGNASLTAAELLAAGKSVGWFQGAMEFGPRALGNRSILANPSIKGISDKINQQVKFREKWRPFCPSILKEHAKDIIDSSHPSPFMTFSFMVSEKWRKRIAEVVHIDGSARPQIVSRCENQKFYDLISYFYEKTGIPLVLNTSLNRKGEPIVCTPRDALGMFYGCGLESLIIGEFLIQK